MLSVCSLVHSSGLRRTVHSLAILLAFSYILFDVLDLDGSNFARLLTPTERSKAVAEASTPAELVPAPEAVSPWDEIPRASIERLRQFKLARQWTPISLSPIALSRVHGYHVGLPRDAVPD